MPVETKKDDGFILLHYGIKLETQWTLSPRSSALPENEPWEDVAITVGPLITSSARRIVKDHLPRALHAFLVKNADYADDEFHTADMLGARGQFAELWRKVGKLKGPMWDDKKLNCEQAEEIIGDMIGHCLLALDFLAKEKEKGNG